MQKGIRNLKDVERHLLEIHNDPRFIQIHNMTEKERKAEAWKFSQYFVSCLLPIVFFCALVELSLLFLGYSVFQGDIPGIPVLVAVAIPATILSALAGACMTCGLVVWYCLTKNLKEFFSFQKKTH